jgi:fatty acid CoA ligase FadD9
MVVTAGAQSELFAPALLRCAQLLRAEPLLARSLAISSVSQKIAQPGLRSSQIIQELLFAYADRPALGERITRAASDPRSGVVTIEHLPDYRTITFRELRERVQAVVTSWSRGDPVKVKPGDVVCLLGFASIDYVSVDLACAYAGAVSVPLQTTLYHDDLVKILAETRPVSVVASLENIEAAAAAVNAVADVNCIVVMDYDPRVESHKARFEAAVARLASGGSRVELIALGDIVMEHRGAGGAPYVAQRGEDPLVTLFYTSGSTGSPKGAMFPDSLWARWWSGATLPIPMINLCYQPLNHGMGRFTVINSLKTGGTCYFAAKSDMSTLFEDARLVRPLVFDFVPRVAETVYHHFNNEVASRLRGGAASEQILRAELMQEMRAGFLGGRVVNGIIGTAPAEVNVAQFIRDCFQIPLVDVFGSTETGPVTYNGVINRQAVIDYKLREVPELGYYPTDKPFPRGELLVKTRSSVAGYYKSPELTAQLFVDGYVATGDIFEQQGPDRIAWVDRRNNVQKLAQGEYVAISRVESILTSGDSLIRHLFLYGNSKRAFTLAVIVPDMEVARARLGHEPGADELKTLLQEALSRIGQREKLRAYEIPRDFIVEREAFTATNGLLSSVSKLVRPALKRRYGEGLEALYAELETRRARETERLRAMASELGAEATVMGAVKATLGLTHLDLSHARSFAELGGDSLAAVSLSTLLEDIFNVPVPVGTILNPAGGLRDVLRHIQAELRAGKAARPTFASVHGQASQAGTISAKELRLETLLDSTTLTRAVDLPIVTEPPRTVLLTGATGFLGRFLCLQWLEELTPLRGRLVCLIRAPDDAAARRRLKDAIGTCDPALAARFAELEAERLEVLASDVSASNLGLAESRFARLAEQVDLICHPAALVNHMLGYRQLFEPNVLGTAELIRLALQRRRTPFDFISTLGVAMRADGTSLSEDEDVRETCPRWSLGAGYANGYVASKWAGEVLLREAHARFGLPVNVFRSDMILPHSVYKRQINAPDVFCRLLFSILQTSLAPRSFYDRVPDAGQPRPHYSGLPVDFTARAVVDIGAARDAGYHTYNVVNSHDDGISLDTIVDWIAAEGVALERIESYPEWLARFETALRQLPDHARQLSSLAVLDQLRRPLQGNEFTQVQCGRFRQKLQQASVSRIPHLTRAYISKCVRDIQQGEQA